MSLVKRLSKDELISDLNNMGIYKGDTLLVTANLGKIGLLGKRKDTARNIIDCILECIGEEGTLVSLAYTKGSFIVMPRKEDAFTLEKRSYAGALPNEMLKYENSFRSRHPVCSYVAIGKNAKYITENHNEDSLSYIPVRKIMELKGKCVTLGCANESIGFTTTHLAETDLNLHKRLIFTKKIFKGGYIDKNNQFQVYKRSDPSICTENFPALSGHYLRYELLKTGWVGNAYTIIADAYECYKVDYEVLKNDPRFHICKNADCFQCRLNRWDTLHKAPWYFLRKVYKMVKRRIF